MPISRRQFVCTAQSFLGALSLSSRAFADQVSGLAGANSDLLFTREKFLPLVNSSFEVISGSGQHLWMTLLSVDDIAGPAANAAPLAVAPKPARFPSPKLNTFTMRFQGTGQALAQGTYQFIHSSTGSFPMFVVPSGNLLYTATICRLAGPAPGQPPSGSNRRGPLQQQ